MHRALASPRPRSHGSYRFKLTRTAVAGALGMALVFGTTVPSAFASPEMVSSTAESSATPSTAPLLDTHALPTEGPPATIHPAAEAPPVQVTPSEATEASTVDGSVLTPENPGAFMGQGISKQSRGIALNSPMTMRGLVDEVATAQVAASTSGR